MMTPKESANLVARSGGGGGAEGLRIGLLFAACLAVVLEPVALFAAPITIPVKQWVALTMPDRGFGIPGTGMKHVTAAYNPTNGRIYFVGGDYQGSGDFYDSYRQETWSLSIADRFNGGTNQNAGWRLEYPYCGPSGQIQPKHPDFVGWQWDSKRHVFWMIPGQMVNEDSNCPGESPNGSSDPGFIYYHIMKFDSATQKWSDVTANTGNDVETWMSIYDPVTDTFIRMGNTGDAIASVFNPNNNTWTDYPLGTNSQGQTIYISKEYLAPDFQNRVIYVIDGIHGRLHRYQMDTHRLEDLGSIPGGSLNSENVSYDVWDPVNRVLLFFRDPNDTGNGAFYAYHPDTKTWETLSTASNIPGVNARGRMMTYDPGQNVVLLMGGGVDTGGNPYMFLYRYGYGSGQDTTPPAPPTGLVAR
jgi:hypothetical protein